NAIAGLGGGAQWNRVGDNQLIQLGRIDIFDGLARQHRVRAIRNNLGGAEFLQRGGGLAQRAGGIDHVVDDDAAAAFDVTDDVHDLGDIGRRAALVDDGEVGIVHLFGDGARAHDAADVRRHYDQVRIIL